MRKAFVFLLCSLPGLGLFAQQPVSAQRYKACKTEDCQIKNAFQTAEYFLDQDAIELSQKWLSQTKELLNPSQVDTTLCYVHSLQSELFYYNGLFQFGKTEALKEIAAARKIKDSLLLSDGYLFLGINQFELGENLAAERALWHCKAFFPKNKIRKTIRATVGEVYIYNNLAQIKIRLHEPDSAFWYNRKAYQIALKSSSRRGVPNAEQTFGEIFLSQKNPDSASFYFKKSLESALHNQYYDTALLNYGFLLGCHQNDVSACRMYYQKGIDLLEKHQVNAAFQKLFFRKALSAIGASDPQKTIFLQNRILSLNEQAQAKSNEFFQTFTEQYVRNEKKLLSLQVQKLKKQKAIVLFQLLIALLVILVLALSFMYIRRKNKLHVSLLDQKNQISKDLHDDVGSGISSILIHAELLLKGTQSPEKQQLLLGKIGQTAREVSQRINTFIWSLNAENNTLRDFMEYLKNYAENLFEGTPIELRFAEELSQSKKFLIDGKTRKNLFFSVKEILNNALKHSQANLLVISVDMADKKHLRIQIQDNGVGLCSENAFGNGIKNLSKRVEEMHGTLHLESRDGLKTSIIIPLEE